MPSAERLPPAGFAAAAAMKAQEAPAGPAQPVLPCGFSPPPPAPPPSPDPNKTFIEIALVDRAGAPVAYEAYRVLTPSGETVDGSLDEDGLARLEGLDPGQCQVTFPDIDGRLWRRK